MKWILRKATEDILPPETTWRTTKQGFPFPLAPWLQTSKGRFFTIMRGTDVPFVDLRQFEARYEHLSRTDAPLAWRIISVSLWWKKCVLGQELQPLSGTERLPAATASTAR
jgi:hypothetical protein